MQHMGDDPNAKLPRPLPTFPPKVWARLDPGQRAAFIRLWQRDLRTFTPEQWARLDPSRRAAFNRLRKNRSLPPYDEPAADLSPRPYVPAPGLLDPNSPLACQITRGGDPEGVLWQELKTVADVLLAAHDRDTRMLMARLQRGVATPEESRFAAELLGGDKRAAHRPATLSRELREDTAKIFLRAWYWLEPHQRKSLKTVIDWVGRNCRLSRAEAFEILKKIKDEVVEHAELADGTVVEPATAMRASEGFLIRKQDESRQRPRRRRKTKMKGLDKGKG
jgi:hypothetical protein